MDAERVHAFTDDALGDHDAVALAELVRHGERSPAELASAAGDRAARVAQLGAVEYAAPEPVDRAASPEAPLYGVPTYVKDNTAVEGMPTGYGTAALRPHPEPHDGRFARQFLGAGFTVLGKSRLPEFGFNASTEFESEEPTRNPWQSEFSSGASSGGAAALVAAGVVPIAHANDGGGSIRIPAACCGLVGLKPSRGRLVDGEQARTMPINLIGEGVVTRSVRDSAAFFYAAERYWRNPRLPALPVGAGFVRDFTLYWGLLSYSVSRFGRRMLGPGFDPAKLDGFSRGLRELFGRRRLSVPSTLYRLSRVRRSYAASFARHDLVLSPVLAHVTPKLGYLSPTVPFDELLERLIGYVAFTPLNNVSGGPAISLPVGAADNGLPIGVQFSARHGDERTLLEIGYELEQALPWRRIQDRAPAPR